MAVVTFLFSFLARKAGDIVQAIFGWSVTALFGRLSRRSQIMVTIALLLSLAWPLFVLGVFLPKLAVWALAFVPLSNTIAETPLRILWIVLAVAAPIGVGLLVWFAAPTRKGGVVRAIVNGYPTALGFFLAFVVIVITVPIIKIASIARRWSDEHVYVQPHADRYDEVVRALAEASARAGFTSTIGDAPRSMVLATSIMRTFARGAVTPFVTEKLQRIAGPGFEMYLYPADLLLRGEAKKVAHIRALFGRTKLDETAYLVASPKAQKIQDELTLLDEKFRNGEAEPMFVTRLRQAYAKMMQIDIPYDEWTMLESIARRFERRLLAAGVVPPDMLPIDQVADRMAEVESLGRKRQAPAPAVGSLQTAR